MRTNQITIIIERFGDSAPDGVRQTIKVYADSHDTCAALCAAYFEALRRLHEGGLELPPDGTRESHDITDPQAWARFADTLKQIESNGNVVYDAEYMYKKAGESDAEYAERIARADAELDARVSDAEKRAAEELLCGYDEFMKNKSQ